GRLKSDYRITKDNVYNNFPWPEFNEDYKSKVENTAKKILEAREIYKDISFSDIYGHLELFPEIFQAHKANDRAVMEAYGMWGKVHSEAECVAWLFRLYQELTEK
ncbi:MAG: hypothetical protein IJ181_11270, partial [Acidaminococcaceae bacterium]|nr:hypothetical protein [Acidaminococcaceae bacterium]